MDERFLFRLADALCKFLDDEFLQIEHAVLQQFIRYADARGYLVRSELHLIKLGCDDRNFTFLGNPFSKTDAFSDRECHSTLSLHDGTQFAHDVLLRHCMHNAAFKFIRHQISTFAISALTQGVAGGAVLHESVIRFRIHRIRQRGNFLGRDLTILHLFQTQFCVLYGHLLIHNSFLLSIKQPSGS